MKKLYSGFDLCQPSTSVSMTINGPAPMILAMFMNTATDQQVERYLKRKANGTPPSGKSQPCTRRTARAAWRRRATRVCCRPTTTARAGAGLRQRDQLLERELYERIRAQALQAVAAPCRRTSSRRTRRRTPAFSPPNSPCA